MNLTRGAEGGTPSETCGHPRPHKREGPAACGGRGRSEAETVSNRIPSPGLLFYVEQLTPEIDEEDGDVGGGDTGDAGGLGDGFGLVAL